MNYTFLLFSFIIFATTNSLAFRKYLFGGDAIQRRKYLACKDSSKTLIAVKNMSNEDKQVLLDAHNKLRNFLAAGKQRDQPPAENMLEMVWDEDAAAQATLWASGCVFEHNKPHDWATDSPMGQNLYIKMTTARSQTMESSFQNVADMVKSWYDEVKDYEFGDGFKPSTGHYTQVIWANSGKLGCGFSYFSDHHWKYSYLVCNYSPSGNYIGQLPYVVGKVDCKKNNLLPSSNYSNLCVKK